MNHMELARREGAPILRELFAECDNPDMQADCKAIVQYMDECGYEYNHDRLSGYIDHLKKNKVKRYSAALINHRVWTIRSLLKSALDRDHLSLNEHTYINDQINRIKYKEVTKKKAEYLTYAEVMRLMTEAPPKQSVLIEFLFFTGMRISEALSIGLNSDYITHKATHMEIVFDGKGGKERRIKVKYEVINRIRELYGEHDTFFGNLTAEAASMQIKRLGIKVFGTTIVTGADSKPKKIPNKNISAHTLRHSAATYLIGKGYPISAVSKYLGHKNIHTTISMYDHNELTAEQILDGWN